MPAWGGRLPPASSSPAPAGGAARTLIRGRYLGRDTDLSVQPCLPFQTDTDKQVVGRWYCQAQVLSPSWRLQRQSLSILSILRIRYHILI